MTVSSILLGAFTHFLSLSLSPQSNDNDPLVGKQSSAKRVPGQDEDIRSAGRDHESQGNLASLIFCQHFWRGSVS